MRRLSILAAAVLLLTVCSAADARHPHRGWGGGYAGWGGGFYSNTCYAGFNTPWIGWGGGYGCAYGSCNYPRSVYYGGYPAYNSYYYNTYPYGIGGYDLYYNAPVFAPAEALYGPAAVRRFFGMPEPTAPAAAGVVTKDLTELRTVREASPEYHRKAEQFIAQGDMLFREQKYQQAVERYKVAVEMAPDSAEAYWHKGHAYAATKRYVLAAANFRRALVLNPDIGRDGFTLDTLYGDTRMAKAAHLEAIAGYCLENPAAAEAYFTLGVFLHYNGEAERAEKFFARAGELAGPDATYLTLFAPGAVPVKADEMEL